MLSIGFLSTPSARRATCCPLSNCLFFTISIHALREEGDISFFGKQQIKGRFLSTPSARRATKPPRNSCPAAGYFYPRPPRGGRQYNLESLREYVVFLSTPSARRATTSQFSRITMQVISIHALREEGDLVIIVAIIALVHFYPRPPRGGRQIAGPSSPSAPYISIHALREEGDRGDDDDDR